MNTRRALTLLALPAFLAAASAPPLSPEQALNRRAIGELEFSSDGSRLAFTVADPPKGSVRQRHLWLLDVATSRVRELTTPEGKSDSSPRWSPDGRFIAFLGNRDAGGDAQHLYMLPMAGGEAERLVDAKESVTAFRWAPDGHEIAFLMAEPKSDAVERRERDRDDRKVVDKEDRRPRIWVVDVARRTTRRVTSGGWRIDQIEWMPAGGALIASATDKPESDQWTDRIYRVSLADGQFTPVASPRGPLGAFAVSPDGATIAYVGARMDGPEPHDLWIQRLAAGRVSSAATPSAATATDLGRNVTAASIDRPISQPRWIDNRSLVAHVARGFSSALVTIDVASGYTFDRLELNPSAFARSTTGTIAYVGETTTRPPDLWIKPANGSAAKVTGFNDAWSSIPVAAPEFVRYPSADGAEIEAALLRPPDSSAAASTGRLPFVVLVHGGPTGRWSDAFEAWGQLLASRGYAVLYPNVRGSTGYGQRFVEMNRADWGGGDFKDVMAGVDWAVARGIADPNRLGIGGWSYGGYMAAWAVTQTTRFRAAVSGAPVIDLASEFGTETGPAYDEWFYGLPYEKLDGFVRSSPITHVRQVKTPTLLLQGEDDTTDPIGQSQQFYRGLKRYGVDSDLVLYPREGHGLREEKHLVDRLNRVVAWFDKYLKPATPATQPQEP
jgi:dipeptidyl aminopeptidase/acylaminoacyl peptidase